MNIAIVGMSPDVRELSALAGRCGLASSSSFADPDRLLYRALDLRRGSFRALFGPRVWLGGIAAALRGHGIGRLEGDGFQMPGAFVIHRGRVVRSYRHTTAADRPNLAELACPTT
jgi:hypothetical protein